MTLTRNLSKSRKFIGKDFRASVPFFVDTFEETKKKHLDNNVNNTKILTSYSYIMKLLYLLSL